MMKHIILSLFVLAVATGASAANIRLRSERVAMPAEQLTGQVWNASTLAEIDSRSRATVSSGNSGLVFENVRRGFTELYLQRGDSIYFRGLTYGREMGVLLDDTVAVAPLSLAETSLAGSFTGSVHFISGRRGRLGGEFTAMTGKPGRFIFAPGDTIDAIQRHERRSTVSDMPDPGLNGTIEYWRWYTPGASLPFAVQYSEDGGEPRLFMSESVPEIDFKDNSEPNSDELLRQILGATSIEINEGSVVVSFGSSGRVHAEVYIFDSAGHIFAARDSYTDSGEAVVIETRSLAPGSYLAVVMLDGKPEFTIKKGFAI